MLGLLWFTVWATVGDAFYDDYNRYTSGDGSNVDGSSFDWQRYLRENFSDSLRTFAYSYGHGQEIDNEISMSKAKSKLRTLKVFQYTGGSQDFEESKGRTLPLSEGEKYCTMGRHTKVECNHCTCVAGQLYMCTGMVCPESDKKPPFLATCKEGKKRKIDSCNYCYCHNGHEFCSTKDCRHNHGLRNKRNCREGMRRRVDDCNRCICRNGEEYCTNRPCKKNLSSQGSLHKQNLLWAKCREGNVRPLDSCNNCYCRNGREYCENKDCRNFINIQYTSLRNDIRCVEGSLYKPDSCNYCFCFKGREICTQKTCDDIDLDGTECNPLIDYVTRYFGCNYCQCRKSQQLSYTIKDNRWYWSCTLRESERKYDYEENDDHTQESYLPVCKEGSTREIDSCNYCLDFLSLRGRECDRWDVKYMDCNHCECRAGRWICTQNKCKDSESEKGDEAKKNVSDDDYNWLYLPCNNMEQRKFDACNRCFCRRGQWFCQNKDCGSPQNTKDSNPDIIVNTDNSNHHKSNEYNNQNGYPNIPDNTENHRHPHIPDNISLNTENIEYPKVPENTDNNIAEDLVMVPESDQKSLDHKCKVGKQVKFECHEYEEGLSCAVVKIRECKPTLRSNEPLRNNPVYECELGRTQRIDACNYCWCNHERKWVCTNEKCNLGFSVTKRVLRTRMNETRCTEGSRREVDPCNYCLCKNGVEFCTRKPCLHGIPKPECFPGEPVPAPDTCNLCMCLNRDILCTTNPCSRRSFNFQETSASLRELDGPLGPNGCRIGYKYQKDECNFCYCTFDRRFICTEEECLSPDRIPALRNKPVYECALGRRQRIDACNYCWCNHERKWLCSSHKCDSVFDVNNLLRMNKTLCSEGSRRQVDPCNYCLCINGVEFCTQKPCWHGLPKPLFFMEPKCIPGQPVPAPDPCNMCMCSNEDILCTNILCLQRTSGLTRTGCVEGHKYSLNDGCNYCVCQNGQEFCTARACLVPEKGASDQNTSCNEGEFSSANDECNMCVCIQGKITCTNKDCSRTGRSGWDSKSYYSSYYERKRRPRGSKFTKKKMSQVTKQKCIPGKYYAPKNDDPNCPNSCICDRNELLCTQRKCGKRGDFIATRLSWLPKTDKYRNQGFKHESCVENQPLPSYDPCNSCLCLNERKVCTIIQCTEKVDSYEVTTPPDNEGKGIKGNMQKKKSGKFCKPFTFFSPDNNRFCRNCFCLHNGLALCLLNLCKYSKDIPHHTPEKLNEICTPGETGYPTKCVTCTCSDKGKWICTREELALCQERDCDEKDEFQMGFFPFCAGCKCAVKEWFCAIQSESCHDYSNATCPLGTFILNPRQHCSLCLCGGYEEGSYNMCFTEAKCVRQVTSHLQG